MESLKQYQDCVILWNGILLQQHWFNSIQLIIRYESSCWISCYIWIILIKKCKRTDIFLHHSRTNYSYCKVLFLKLIFKTTAKNISIVSAVSLNYGIFLIVWGLTNYWISCFQNLNNKMHYFNLKKIFYLNNDHI